MVLVQETNFFLGKTKKTIFLEFGHIVSQKMVFLFFFVFPRKKLVFRSKTIFFLEKIWFCWSRTIFFLGKSWFFRREQTFS